MAWFFEYLTCPDCQSELSLSDGAAACPCGFATTTRPQLDLRPRRPAPRSILFEIGSTASSDLADVDTDRPVLTYRGPRALRDSAELFSAVEQWLQRGDRMLDLGCGPRDQAEPAAFYGLDYVGLDFTSPAADLLGDGHSIPFRSATFEIVFTYAVLEHLYNPFVAMSEIARVLRPGGILVGTVAQGEPFHESYFHHTSLGLLTVLRSAGLRPVRLWPTYDTLHALSQMGRYARAQRMMIEAVYRIGKALPMLAPRKYFNWSRREQQIDELHRTAAICFVAEKPAG